MIKLIYDRKLLLAACRNAARPIPRRCLQPILECVRLTASIVTGTNIDTTITVRLQAPDLTDSREIITPAKRLIEVLLAITDHIVTLQVDNDGQLTANETFKLESHDPQDYPHMPFITDANAPYNPAHIDSKELIKALDQTLFAATDYDNSILSGLHIKGNNLCCTDGSRMSWVTLDTFKLDAKTELETIAPASELAHIQPLLKLAPSVTVVTDGKIIQFESPAFMATTRVIPGTYPRYTELFPEKNGTSFTFTRKTMAAALKALKGSLNKQTNLVTLDLQHSNVGNGTDTVPLELSVSRDNLPPVNVNYHYLQDVIESLTQDMITVHTGHPSGSKDQTCILKPLIFEQDNYKHLLMPVQSSTKK